MIQIKPISDLRNKFTNIEKLVKNGEPVFLTKNGEGSMVVLSIEAYSRLAEGIEKELDKADYIAEHTKKRYSHSQVFDKVRGNINAKK